MSQKSNLPGLPENKQKEIVETAQKAVRKRNRPDLVAFGQENVQPGDNSRYLRNTLALFDLPAINVANAAEVKDRIHWYFNHCIDNDTKPTVNGLAMAIGVKRQVLWNWANGVDRVETHKDMVVRAYQIMETLWEDYMQNGKINPVSGIFLGKNHFGYQDKSEVVLTPNNMLGSAEDPETVRQRYLAESSDGIEYEKINDKD